MNLMNKQNKTKISAKFSKVRPCGECAQEEIQCANDKLYILRLTFNRLMRAAVILGFSHTLGNDVFRITKRKLIEAVGSH